MLYPLQQHTILGNNNEIFEHSFHRSCRRLCCCRNRSTSSSTAIEQRSASSVADRERRRHGVGLRWTLRRCWQQLRYRNPFERVQLCYRRSVDRQLRQPLGAEHCIYRQMRGSVFQQFPQSLRLWRHYLGLRMAVATGSNRQPPQRQHQRNVPRPRWPSSRASKPGSARPRSGRPDSCSSPQVARCLKSLASARKPASAGFFCFTVPSPFTRTKDTLAPALLAVHIPTFRRLLRQISVPSQSGSCQQAQ